VAFHKGDEMTITEKQLAARDSGLGSSEIAAILGRDPWRTAWDVWAVKTGRADSAPANDAMRIGTAFERVLLDLASEELGRKIVAPTSTFVRGVMRANIDGMLDRFAKGGEIVEAKTTSVTDGWGPAGSNEVPERVALQVQFQMLCAESSVAHVAKLSAAFGFSFALYRIERDEDVCAEIEARCEEWWARHVIEGKEPDAAPSPDVLARVRRDAKKVDIDATLIARERIARDELAAAEAKYEAAKSAVLHAMGDADTATDGTWTIRFHNVSRTGLDTAAIVARWPEAAEMKKATTYRRFDVRKAGGKS
jgi:putative phage-type endonuclease